MKTALKWGAIGALILLVPVFLYAMAVLILPATFFGMTAPFAVPESVGVNPYLGRAITLTFGFLAAVLLIKYMIDWRWFERKILAFAGIVAVFVAWNLFMWWTTTAEPRQKMSDLRQQNKAQQTAIAQCEDKTKELRVKAGKAENATTACAGRVAQFQQALAAKEQMLTSKAQDSKALAEADAQKARELTQCRGDMETRQKQLQTAQATQVECARLNSECQQALAVSERDRQAAIAADAQKARELTQCRAELKGARDQCAAIQARAEEQGGRRDDELEMLKSQIALSNRKVENLQRELSARSDQFDQGRASADPQVEIQPVVYSPPPATHPSPAPKPKAKVVILKEFYAGMSIYGGQFFIELVEKNGVDVVFDRRAISIWRRDSKTQPIDAVKRNKPAVFERSGFEVVVKGGSGNPKKLEYTLEQYQEWLRNDEWVELTLSGTDANGYSHTLTFSGAD